MKKVLKDNTNFVKEDYKMTKLGWIPNEWEVINLGKLGEFSKGKGVAKKDILENDTEGFSSIRYAEIYTLYDYYTYSLKTKINEESASNSNPINYGDILFAGSGETLEDIGKSVSYLGNETAYAGGDIIILKQNTQDAQYLGYLMNNDIVRSQLFKLGQGHSVVHIYSSGLKKVLIPLPPHPEQQKIAQILGTWDKAIALQEQLVTEKQALKKGLIQQLLTGKRRFPEFDEEWEEAKLKELGEIVGGGTPSTKKTEFWKGVIPWLSSSDLKSNDLFTINKTRFITKNAIEESATKLVPANSILIVSRVGVGKIAITKEEICTSQDFTNLVPNKGDLIFLGYKIQSEIGRLISHNQGTSIKGFTKKSLESLKIKLPIKEEQEKIAGVLSNFDTEIESLIKYKGSLIQQKQGLMQQLLTGEKLVKI